MIAWTSVVQKKEKSGQKVEPKEHVDGLMWNVRERKISEE